MNCHTPYAATDVFLLTYLQLFEVCSWYHFHLICFTSKILLKISWSC